MFACALAAVGCASPPDTNQCATIVNVGCPAVMDGGVAPDAGAACVLDDGGARGPIGYYDDASAAWVTSASWTSGLFEYQKFTTYRLYHGLGRAPVSVDLFASFYPTGGNLAPQIGNVTTVVTACGAEEGVTDRYILLRNGGGENFYVRVILR